MQEGESYSDLAPVTKPSLEKFMMPTEIVSHEGYKLSPKYSKGPAAQALLSPKSPPYRVILKGADGTH